MSPRRFEDPYRAVIRQFNRRGVRYVVVGLSGINYYAKGAAEAFATLDYDVFMDPTLKNVEQALQSLTRLGFAVGAATGLVQAQDLRGIVRAKRTLVATTPDGLTVELLLAISGFTFAEVAKDAATFVVRGVPVKVGRLTKLLQSKKVAGRRKDRDFLRRYTALLDTGAKEPGGETSETPYTNAEIQKLLKLSKEPGGKTFASAEALLKHLRSR